MEFFSSLSCASHLKSPPSPPPWGHPGRNRNIHLVFTILSLPGHWEMHKLSLCWPSASYVPFPKLKFCNHADIPFQPILTLGCHLFCHRKQGSAFIIYLQ